MPKLPGVGDLVELLQAQTAALMALPDTLAALNRSVRSLVTLASEAQDTLRSVDALAQRADGVLSELEEPLRALRPGLARLAAVLDDPSVDQLAVVVGGLVATQEQVAAIAASTTRIMAFVDEAGARFEKLPGAGLVSRNRRKPAT